MRPRRPGLPLGLAAPDQSDAVIEQEGARLFVEDGVAQLLDDKMLDAHTSGSELRFSIPDQS